MAEIDGLSRPSADGGAGKRAPALAVSERNSPRAGFAALASMPVEEWRALAERAIEPNGYYLPAWELAVNASAHGRTGVSALGAWRDASPNELVPNELVPSEDPTSEPARLIGLLPVVRTPAFNMVSDGQTFKLWIPPRNRFVEGRNDVPTRDPKTLLKLFAAGVMFAVANQVGNAGYYLFGFALILAGLVYSVLVVRGAWSI